jgi:hypothetical protein
MKYSPSFFRRHSSYVMLAMIAVSFVALAWRSTIISNRWGVYTLGPVRNHYSTSIRPGIPRDSVEKVLRGYENVLYYAVQRQTYRTAPAWYGVEEYVFSLRPFKSFSVFVIYDDGAVLDVEFDPIYLRHRRTIDSRTADSLINL